MNRQQGHSPAIGSAFDLGKIASALDCTTWVCFARSRLNPEIMRLAPASERPLTSDAVRIRSKDNAVRWLVPGVEVAVHSLDLRDVATGESFEISASDDEAASHDGAPNDDDAVRGGLSEIALTIETHFHEPAEPVLPTIDECRVDSVARGEPAAQFSWTPDLRRTYRLTRTGNRWQIRQRYDSADVVPSDALVPLRAIDSVISFSSSEDGAGTATVADAEQLLKALGLHYSVDTNELRKGTTGTVIPIAEAIRGRQFSPGAFKDTPARAAGSEPTHGAWLRLAANDPQFRRAANASFSTEEASSTKTERTVKFDWGGDTVDLIARPDPTGRRVQLEVRIDAPRSARPGARLEVRFPALQSDPAGVVLSGSEVRLHGATSIAIPWAVFSMHEDTLIEVLGAPAAR